MKKLLLFLTCNLFLLNISFAGDITIKEGSDVPAILQTQAYASVEFVYTNTMAEGVPLTQYLQNHGEDWVQDWGKEHYNSETHFIDEWNSENKKGIKASRDEKSDYRIVVTVNSIDFGSTAAALTVGMGAGGAKMYGKIEIFKNGITEPILVAVIDRQTGYSQYTMQKRLESLYECLAEDVVVAMKKSVK